MNGKEDITKFYDDFSSHQQQVAFNERHLLLFDKLKKLGMNSVSNMLELGCGIGVITSLMSKVVKKGFIVAVDISPKSVEMATERLKNKTNIKFKVSDIKNFVCDDNIAFDFITMFDVLEHIAMKEHQDVFKMLSQHMNDKTTLLINIPSPASVEYDKKHRPHHLQIVDQALPANHIIDIAYNTGLKLDFFITYSIWERNDYQLISFKKRDEHEGVKLNDKRTLFEKIKKKIQFMMCRIYYGT